MDSPILENKEKITESEFDALRNILLGPEKTKVEQLQQQFERRFDPDVDDPQEHAKAISRLLPEAVKLSTIEGKQLSAELMPTVEEAVRVSVKRDIHVFADALFPVIGPAIRKSISETFRQMVQSINQALEHSFSWKGLKWRFEAWRTGKSFAEIVLLHSLVYRVEQVFLIHKESGILLQHIALPEVEHQDADLVSAMLTAIQDFVKDSFNVNAENNLNQVSLGDFSLWIEQGPDAVIAGVIRGNAPEAIRQTLQTELENIHQNYKSNLKEFEGDITPFNSSQEQLQHCLLSQYQSEKKKISWLTWGFLGSVGLFVLGWLLLTFQAQQHWLDYVENLKAEPGFIITDARKVAGEYVIQGLRDPLAKKTEDLLKSISFSTSFLPSTDIKYIFQPYQSLQDEFVLKRSIQLLNPPDTVSLKLEQGILWVSGKASSKWINELSLYRHYLAGVEGINKEQLSLLVDFSQLKPPSSVQLTMQGNSLIATGAAPYIWKMQARKQATSIPGISHYDDSQLKVIMDFSSLQLPEGVELEFNQGELKLSGDAPNQWIENLSQRIAEIPGINKINLDALNNADLKLFTLVKQEIESEAIFFGSGLSITDTDNNDLKRVLSKIQLLIKQARILSQSIRVIIQGHSDSIGRFQRRVNISLQRAEDVRQFLIAAGVNPDLLEITSMVKNNKPSMEQSEQEMRFNRRVSFVIRVKSAGRL